MCIMFGGTDVCQELWLQCIFHLAYDPDSSPSLYYIWSWFFPVTVLYMILILPRHCLIYDPNSSPSLSYIWSWFFPVTVFYMILILPRHCLIYDPDSSPVTLLYMILILPHHCLIYDPDSSPVTVLYMILILPSHYLIYDLDSSPSLSYIWSIFFPVTVIYDPDSSLSCTVLYMILILPCHCLIYDPDSSPSVLYMILILPRHCLIHDPDSSPSVPNNTDLKNNWNLSFIQYFFILPFMGHLYIACQFSPYASYGEESGYSQFNDRKQVPVVKTKIWKVLWQGHMNGDCTYS